MTFEGSSCSVKGWRACALSDLDVTKLKQRAGIDPSNDRDGCSGPISLRRAASTRRILAQGERNARDVEDKRGVVVSEPPQSVEQRAEIGLRAPRKGIAVRRAASSRSR